MKLSISSEFQEFFEKNMENSKPEFVYHYTDIDAFLGIIQNNELWLTDRNYMNDIYDEAYIKDIIDKFLLSLKSNFLTEGATLDDGGYQYPKKSYIFSTSTKKDVANQWLCYGNSSVCIEFKKDKLVEFITKFTAEHSCNKLGFPHEDEFLPYPISYYEEETVEKIKKFLKERYGNDYSKCVDKDTLQEKIYAYHDYCVICGFIKQKAFAAEQEYRFLVLSKLKPCFRTRNGQLIPYIKVKHNDRNLPITSIIIGPKNHDEYTKIAFRELLISHGYSEVAIEPSSLSLR